MNKFFLTLAILASLILFSLFSLTIRMAILLNKDMIHYIRYDTKSNYLDNKYKNYLTKNLNESKYFGKSGNGDLNKKVFNENDIYGFSIAFKKSNLICVKKHFPYLAPYLDNIIFPDTNCYYVNYLVIKNGKKISTHIDDTLLSYFTPTETFNAKYVTILYLSIDPTMIGGELKLKGTRANKKNKKKTRNIITPKENLLVFFDGNIYHSVNDFKSNTKSDLLRASLVCEQYKLTEQELNSMPNVVVHCQRTNKKINICN